jgi:hypothetical protein
MNFAIIGLTIQEQVTTVFGRLAPIRTVPVLKDQNMTGIQRFYRGKVTVSTWVTLKAAG